MIPGKIYSIRLSVPDDATTLQMPTDFRYFFIKNTSALYDVRINFDDDDSSNYYTLKQGEVSPVVECGYGHNINLDGVGGAATLEFIVWG